MVHPLRNKDDALAHKYNDILLSSPNIQTLPLTPATAEAAAELRAGGSLKTPDAIQLTTALRHNASAFLNNDRDFPTRADIHILRVRDLVSD